MDLDDKIAALEDLQALSILDSLAGEFASDEMPDGRIEQVSLLETILASNQQSLDSQLLMRAETPAAAQAARELLKLMAAVEEMSGSVENWLETPTSQGSAIPMLVASPLLTGSIALLSTVGNTSTHRNDRGKWELTYDPNRQAALNKSVTAITRILGSTAHPGKTS